MRFYERACKFAGRIVKIEPDKERRRKLLSAIRILHLRVTPEETYTFAFLVGMVVIVLALGLVLLGIIDLLAALFFCLLGGIGIYLLADYPIHLAYIYRVKASTEMVLAVIYMTIYMRVSANLEGAVDFAAKNLRGPMAEDFKKMVWAVHTRRYTSMDEALVDYMERWKGSEEFIEPVNLIRSSIGHIESKRLEMLDKAVDTAITRCKEKMQSYARGLMMPIMIIHALGVMLPVLVLVMFPIVLLLLQEAIKPVFLVIGYNILLPIALFMVSTHVLEKRPAGFAVPDISMHPDFPVLGKIKFGKKLLPPWPFAVMVAVPLVILGAWLTAGEAIASFSQMMYSLLIVWGISLGIAVYLWVDSRGKLKIRNDVKRIQDEFGETLFVLGGRLSLGKPLETALNETAQRSSELTIAGLFKRTADGMRRGLTLESALFRERVGAVWRYPSRLVSAVMRLIVQSARKGTRFAAMTATSISRYVREVRRVEEDLRAMLSEATASMHFLGMFLAPLVAGITVTMAAIMMMIFVRLGATMEGLRVAEVPYTGMMLIGGWGGVTQMIPLGVFQLIVGVYLIETCWLLAWLSTGVETGPGDVIMQNHRAAWILLIGMLVYSLSMVLTYYLFATPIQSLLTGGIL